MADSTVSGLDGISGSSVDADNDLVPIVDVSAVIATRSKKISVKELIANTPSFVQSGTGASTETVQTALRRVWYPEQFGAVGDGATDDASAWAAVIAAAGSSNAEIHGKPGAIYLLGTAGITLTSKTNVHLIGNGAKFKLNAAATQTLGTLGSTAIKFDTCTLSSIRGFDCDGNSKASNFIGLTTCTDCEVSGNRVTASGSTAQIATIAGTRTRILRNVVHTATGSARGIYGGNVQTTEIETDILIEGNSVYSNPATGIVCVSTRGRIVGNASNGNAGSGIIVSGGNSAIARNISITGNTCNDNTFSGIQNDPSGSDIPVDIAVTGNVCDQNDASGIAINKGLYWTVTGNVCRDNNNDASGSGYGIECNLGTNCVISSNVCYDSRAGGSRTQTAGISLLAQTASNDIVNVVVSSNICYNNSSFGVWVQTSGSGTISGVTVDGNNCNTNGDTGIYWSEVSAGTITGGICVNNNCRSNTTRDLRLSGTDIVHYGNRYSSQLGVVPPAATVTTAVGNVGAGEDNLQTSSVEANALSVDGDGLRIRAWGTTANNAAAKTLKLYFGTLAISSQTMTANQASDWEFDAVVMRTGTDAQDYTVRFFQDGATEIRNITTGTHTQDDGAAITVKCTGEATSNNDIVEEGLIVERLRIR